VPVENVSIPAKTTTSEGRLVVRIGQRVLGRIPQQTNQFVGTPFIRYARIRKCRSNVAILRKPTTQKALREGCTAIRGAMRC